VIPFTRPLVAENELHYLSKASENQRPWGGGDFFKLASEALTTILGGKEVLLTQSCTSALELAALALDIQPGDEVIVPSYTFVSSASAFALRGARIVYADSKEQDLNIDTRSVRELINEKTRAIVIVHYGGVACDMTELLALAKDKGIAIVEDAAQAIGATFNSYPLGGLSDFGCISFHGTKNVSSGEGGALILGENSEWNGRAQLAHEKGTDRSAFLRGEVDKYTWRTLGSSFIPSEFTASVLAAQLEHLEEITQRRRDYWQRYQGSLSGQLPDDYYILEQGGEGSNGHMFALLVPRASTRQPLISALKSRGIIATSHYEPLHMSPFAIEHQMTGQTDLPVARDLSSRVIRLPMWSSAGLPVEEVSNGFLESVKQDLV